MAIPQKILDEVGDQVVSSSDMGLRFDAEAPHGWERRRGGDRELAERERAAALECQAGRLDVWMNGRAGPGHRRPGVQRATTAIIQYVKQIDSGYGDKFGGITPLAVTVGSGKGLMLRDGRARKITWERPTENDPTAYLDAEGDPVVLDPGQVWIVLVDRTQKVSVE